MTKNQKPMHWTRKTSNFLGRDVFNVGVFLLGAAFVGVKVNMGEPERGARQYQENMQLLESRVENDSIIVATSEHHMGNVTIYDTKKIAFSEAAEEAVLERDDKAKSLVLSGMAGIFGGVVVAFAGGIGGKLAAWPLDAIARNKEATGRYRPY